MRYTGSFRVIVAVVVCSFLGALTRGACPTNRKLPGLLGDNGCFKARPPIQHCCLVFFLCISWTRDLHATSSCRQNRTVRM